MSTCLAVTNQMAFKHSVDAVLQGSELGMAFQRWQTFSYVPFHLSGHTPPSPPWLRNQIVPQCIRAVKAKVRVTDHGPRGENMYARTY